MERKKPFNARVLSVTALLVSIASLAISIWTTQRRHAEWLATAAAQVVVNVDPVIWKVFANQQSAETFAPGYIDVNAAQLAPRDSAPQDEQYGLFVRLVAKDRVSGKMDPLDAASTVTELQDLLLKSHRDPSHFVIRKHLRFRFQFKNVGATPASQFRADIQAGTDSEWLPVIQGVPTDLVAGQSISTFADVLLPIERQVPEYILLRATVDFVDIEGHRTRQTYPFYFAKRHGMIAAGVPPGP